MFPALSKQLAPIDRSETAGERSRFVIDDMSWNDELPMERRPAPAVKDVILVLLNVLVTNVTPSGSTTSPTALEHP